MGALAAISLSAAALEGGLLLRNANEADGTAGATSASTTNADNTDTTVATTSDATDLSDMIASAMESVVAVQTVSTQADMFGRAMSVESEGSGVIVGQDLVVTNAHVVEGASEVTVTFGDGNTVAASVLGTDDTHDVAVLSVSTGDRPTIAIGSSSELELGDTVVALGYPLGLGATATAGIVSGLDRSIDVSSTSGVEHFEGLLQTDAAINPGNSGGALIDSAGRLVGINTAAASASSAENIGFAIAIDEALPVVEDLSQA